MTRPVIIRAEAEMDILHIYGELEDARPGMGQQFAKQLRETLERIESIPEIYGVAWQDVRAVRLKKFRYVLYYVTFSDHTEVLGVIHGARDASVWQSRK